MSRTNLVAILNAAGLVLGAGCASEAGQGEQSGQADHMTVSGTAQRLEAEGGGGSLHVAARWSTEADVPGVYIQIDEVAESGPDRGSFDLDVAQPPAEVMEAGRDADYHYTSAELVLLDSDTLVDGWADAQELADAEVGRSLYAIYYVDRDIPETATGHFGIGPVAAGFHLIERQPDRLVRDDQGRVTAGIAVWQEVPLANEIEIEVGSDGDPSPEL